jgi:hypothetical protein
MGVNIRWNTEKYRFEAELGSGGYKADLAAVQAAKWKCDGPPAWVWHSLKATPLEVLRTKHRPPVLTISPEAREKFNAMFPLEKQTADLKAQMAEHKKALKKKLKADAADTCKPDEYFDEALQCYCIKVAPKTEPWVDKRVIAPPSDEKCAICGSPLYSYEYAPEGPKVCLWDQKIVLDNVEDVC